MKAKCPYRVVAQATAETSAHDIKAWLRASVPTGGCRVMLKNYGGDYLEVGFIDKAAAATFKLFHGGAK